MPTSISTICLLAVLALGASAQEPAPTDTPFPASTALAEGVSPAALTKLDDLVQTLVDDEEIVGAELLVIKNGRSILHEAYGWSDREAEVPMETGRAFCVRSMTKPVIGAAILMLIEDGLLDLGDRVGEHLPAFDVEGTRDITVEHLLTHTSGLPMSLILGKDLQGLGNIQDVARLGAGHSLEFPPGTAFRYSDQGTDTLTALIEVVTGTPVADFVRARVLDPLEMGDSACVLTEDHPLRALAIPKYAGSRGEWTRFWGPDEPSIFPCFLGSQGLYSTLEDYARFMDFWLRRGRTVKQRLLRPRSVRRTLAIGPHPMNGSTGLPGLRSNYGYLMQLWTAPGAEGEDDEVVAFGHTGSDGTHAWVFPGQKAMVLYFTQSRSNITGLRVEEVLGELFLGVPFDPNQVAPPLEQYLGYYWEGEGDMYRAIVRDGDGLALEILGKGVVPLSYAGEDRWKLPDPSVVIAFDRSPAGEVTGYHIGDHQEFRFAPSPDFPSAEEIAARVAKFHRLDLLETLGPLRTSGTVDFEKLGLSGETTAVLAWPDRFRLDTLINEEHERVAFDGETTRYATKARSVSAVDGPRGESMRLGCHFARFGDLLGWHSGLQVIQRLEGPDGEEVFLVRTGDTSAPARTLYVRFDTGMVFREDGLVHVETMGRIGQRLDFRDFRDVSGMQLPFRIDLTLANPMIGTVVTTFDEFELGIELPEGTFTLR